MLDFSASGPALLLLAGLAALFLLHVWRSDRRIASLERHHANLARSIDTIMRAPRRSAESEIQSQAYPAHRMPNPVASPPPAISLREPGEPDRSAVKALSAVGPEAETSLALPDRGALGPEDQEAVARKLAVMIAEDRMEVSLQPIVSVSRGQSVAFDILTRVDLPDLGQVHLKRIAIGGALDPVDFDMSMFLVAVDTARRRMGSVSERMRLHLSLSPDVLRHEEAVADICALVDLHPGIARSMVLSLPGTAARHPDLARAARALSDAGMALALDSDGSTIHADHGLPPLQYVNVEAQVLIALADTMDIGTLDDLWARIWPGACPPIIALGVRTDETALRLIDLGVDLMAGDWFSPPRRMSRGDPHLAQGQEGGRPTLG